MAIVLAGMVGGLTSWQYAEQPYNEAEYALEASNDASDRSVKAGKTSGAKAQQELDAEIPLKIQNQIRHVMPIVGKSQLKDLTGTQKEVLGEYNLWIDSDYSKMDQREREHTYKMLHNVRTFKGLKNVIKSFRHINR